MSRRHNLALIIEYDGTAFHGWQVQPGKRTVQAEIQRAIREVTGHKANLNGASRTDSGVHARGQVAHFHTSSTLSPTRLRDAINYHLPEDVNILEIREESETFHSKRDAKGKWYRYTIFQRDVLPVLERAYVLPIRQRLALREMKKAASLLLGKHDYRAFGTNNRARASHTRKTLYRLSVKRQGPKVYIDVVGDSFLYRMVRGIVGTLLQVGRGKRAVDTIAELLDQRYRGASGPTVPPKGLCLMKVFYNNPIARSESINTLSIL